MAKLTTSDWIQLGTATAVLVGLALVIWELQQSRDIAMAQLASDAFQRQTDQNGHIMGDGAAEVIAKACGDVDELTDGDLLILDSYYLELMSGNGRQYYLAQSGLVDEVTGTNIAELYYRRMFDTKGGRAYWEGAREWVDPGNRELGDSVLSNLGPATCSFYTEYRQRISEQD